MLSLTIKMYATIICSRCINTAPWKCETCDARYCSLECQTIDEPSHKIICHKELNVRLKKTIDWIIEKYGNVHPDSRYWNISYRFYTLESKVESSNYTLNLNPYIRTDLSYGNCAICMGIALDVNYELKYKNTTILYKLCKQCYTAGRELCPSTFKCISKCTSIRLWWSFLMCLRHSRIDIPKDIKRLIFQEISPCTHPLGMIEKINT